MAGTFRALLAGMNTFGVAFPQKTEHLAALKPPNGAPKMIQQVGL